MLADVLGYEPQKVKDDLFAVMKRLKKGALRDGEQFTTF